jgi:sugar O-acyltransferase (sialic acid O-acetyltransferase NeuD family)
VIAPIGTDKQYQPVILWGARGHAKVLNEFLPHLGYRVAAVFDNDQIDIAPLPGVPLYRGMDGLREWLALSADERCFAMVAIGGHRGRVRLEIQNLLTTYGLQPLSAVHPRAFVAADATIGAGSQILAQASICSEVAMGKACIINTNASVDHESVLGDGVHIAPGATVAGCVTIGENAMIGAGAVVLPRLTIGPNSIVGAGSIVTRDIPANKVAFGNPARIIRDIES